MQNTKEKYLARLQNWALRKITFKKQQDSVNGIYKDFKILKFPDLIKLQNCLFVSQLEENEKLSSSFADLKHCGENHNYQTRSKAKKLLDIPLFQTDTYETNSTKYNCITDWNNFRKTFPNIPQNECTYFNVKKLLKEHLLNKY